MATCKYCKRNGLFLSVNKSGLCTTCNSAIHIEAQSRLRVINDSVQLVNTGKTTATRVSRCDLIVEHGQALLKYENMGIQVCTPPPSEMVKIYTDKRGRIIKEGLREEARQAMEKSKLATTVNGRITPLTKVILKVNDYRKDLPNDRDLDILENGLKKVIQDLQLKAYMDDAKLAEFKGNKKKALDKYYEALYFLQHDDIDDRFQSSDINDIEAKIKELT